MAASLTLLIKELSRIQWSNSQLLTLILSEDTRDLLTIIMFASFISKIAVATHLQKSKPQTVLLKRSDSMMGRL